MKMGSCFFQHFRRRSRRIHSERDINMPAADSSPTTQQQQQQQQDTAASNLLLQRGEAQSTPTHAAAVNGDKSGLNKLLNNSRDDINSGDQFGRTPLMLAVLADRLECAELLVKHGTKVNNADNAGRTALHWAAYKGNVRLSKLLLAKGANWKVKDKEGQSALHLATRHDNTKCLMLLIKQLEPGEQDEQDNAKRTALHWSSSYGNEEAVKLLIKHNSNIGIPDMDGKTPLHWAASAGHDVSTVNTVQLILDTEPSVITWQDYEGRTALHLAVAQGNETIAQQLINFQTNLVKCNVSVLDNMFRTPLHWAAVLGHTHIVDLLLDAGANVTSSDANGATPLHYAAQNNHAETVAAFLGRDGITDEPDFEGRTALMWAAGKGADTVIARMMEISQPDINATDKTGATALHAAAMCGHPSTIEVLLELGANVNIFDQSKHTPLFRASEMGHTSVVKVLVQGGAQVDIVDQEGRSPLHWAALGGHACICSILIGEGIDPNVHDFTGRSPLHCASYGGFTNSISLLLEKGADPNSQDSEGMTALHWCCSAGYLDAAKLLLDHGAFPNHMEYTEERLTPLDFALLHEHHHVAQYLIEQGALSITGIRDIAAIRVQAHFRGYRVRKTFVERKKLLMKHEQLRKDAAKKKVEMTKKNEMDESSLECEMQTGSENRQGGQQETDAAACASDKDQVTEGTDEDASTGTKTPTKKLCWEQEPGREIGEDTRLDVRGDLRDEVSSDSGRASDLAQDGLADQELKTHGRDLDRRSSPKRKAVSNSKSSKPTNIGRRQDERSARGLREDIHARVDDANANSNNSNSNDEKPSVCSITAGKWNDVEDAAEREGHSEITGGHFASGASARPEGQSLEDRQQRVKRERQRLVSWRRKSDAATVIQKAWRNFKARRHRCQTGTLSQDTSRLRPYPTGNPDPAAAQHRADPRAARTIQRAWRRFYGNQQFALLGYGKKSDRFWNAQLSVVKQTVVMHQIYDKKQVATEPPPGKPSVRRARPQYQQYIPSAAALSFNFALDQYRPFGRNVKTPSSTPKIAHPPKHSTRRQSRSAHTDASRTGSGKSSKNVSSFSYNHY